ncbi:hypothetical protein CKO43_09085 [Rubrivivax gelatinosus]|uniref:CheW-like domain-containing protein n=1 Tax=Rubrivivax gelatinosus TaxID=28068 RepID=A0ABS1DT98_RUBGE|nr:chemotaxis protein CheW [Rubrivivax gelatinosus]MBK1712931.1 hypothetical protein [Rubrivivax gelatinosus]
MKPVAATDAGTWGDVVVAGIALALPLAALREVLPRGALAALPCDHAAVLGAMPVRGVSVPVIDLGLMLGRSPAAPAPFVLFVVHGSRLLGLACDAVNGVFAAAANSRSATRNVDSRAGHLFDGSVRRADNAALVNLLSVDALAAMPGIPWIVDPEPERQLGADADSGAAGAVETPVRSLMLLHAGRVRLAIDANAVEATLWQPHLTSSVLAQGACRGVLDFGTRRIGAVDLVALCRLHAQAGSGSRQAIVLRHAQGLVALLVERVVEIVRVPAVDIVGGTLFGLPQPELFEGMFRDATWGEHLILNAAALGAHPELEALAATNTDSGTAQQQHGETRKGTAQALITLRLPQEVAVPIDQVDEVLPFGGVDGMFGPDTVLRRVQQLRGRVVPVICLARLLGWHPGSASPSAAVLVVRAGEQWIGFATPRMDSIEHSDWRRRLPASDGAPGVAAQVAQREIVSVGAPGAERTLRLVDLQALAEALLSEGHRLVA